MTSAAADVINHNRSKIGRFKLQWKSLVVLVRDCRVYSANMGMRSSQYSRLTSSCLRSITLEGYSWWRHQMEAFSALLALCAGNSPATGEFPTQRPVTRRFDVYFHLCLNKRLSKQSWGWWFETPLRSLWRHCNVYFCFHIMFMWLCVGKLVYFSFDAQDA